MTSASGLYNVVRQVFGSVGIALSATQLTSGQARFRALLSEHVTPFDRATQQWLHGATGAMTAAGADPATAARRALALLSASVDRQAAVLAYNRVFVLVAILFFLSVPLVVLLRGTPAALPADTSIE
jgi:DHA2 family multidrug resistance protein